MKTVDRHLVSELRERLLRGEQVVLHGPRGGGKTTVLVAVAAEFLRGSTPCTVASPATMLADLVDALAATYGISSNDPRHLARSLVRTAVEARSGVLLVDHVAAWSPPMRTLVRSLAIGALVVVDVDSQTDHARMRRWRISHREIEMPRMSSSELRALLRAGVGDLRPADEAKLIRAARGRPGWVTTCARFASDPRYRTRGALGTEALACDVEIALRTSLSTLAIGVAS